MSKYLLEPFPDLRPIAHKEHDDNHRDHQHEPGPVSKLTEHQVSPKG